jgi:Fe-S-cluster containining protein
MPSSRSQTSSTSISFMCQRCGRCCTDFYVNVIDTDIRRIVKETGRVPQDFVDLCPRELIVDNDDEDCYLKMNGGEHLLILAERMGRCAFQLPDKRCEIYEARPLACRLFPFDVKDGKVVINDEAIGVCKGLSAGGRPNDEKEITSVENQWSHENARFAERVKEWNRLADQGKVNDDWQSLLSYLTA